MTLQDFYKSRFDANPYALLDAASADLASIASAAGIDWNAVSADIQLINDNGDASKFSKYTGRSPGVTDKSFKGRADLYSRIESKNGIEYPFINFVTKGHDGGVWSGLDFLWNEYRRVSELGGPAGPLTDRELACIAKAAKQLAEREERARVSKLMAMQHRDQALQFYLQFSRLFDAADTEHGDHPYLMKKGIAIIPEHTDIRRVPEGWARGPTSECLAIPLRRIDGEHRIAGWQRIYPDGRKLNTPAIDGGDYVGACHVIGNLRHARRVCVAEGFASAAAVYLATQGGQGQFDAVIMTLSANNMLPVVEQLVECYPSVDLFCALDNDVKSMKSGKGNTGIATGINILKKFSQIKCVFPVFDEQLNYSDFNDLYNLSGTKKTRSQILSKSNRLEIPENAFDADLQLLDVTPRVAANGKDSKAFLQQLGRCISSGLLYCPAKFSPKELAQTIINKLKRLGALQYIDLVKNQLRRRFEQKCQKAQSFRSFSERYTNPAICPSHVQYHYYESHKVTSAILDDIRMMTDGPVIVRAPMGSGKTQGLLRKLMQESDRGVAIAHRVSLIGNMWDVLSRDDNRQRIKADILHYQDAGASEQAPWARKLTICVNSIIKGCWQPLMRNHDFLGFDEATQGLRATLSGKAMKHPVAVFNALIDGIAHTDGQALLVDADASDMLVQICELAMKRRDEIGLRSWQKIHVVELRTDTRAELPDGTLQARRVFYTDVNRVMSEALDSAERDEKFLLATDSKAFADQLLLLLRESYPDKRWLYVSQDTKPEPEVDAFTNAPNKLASQYDGLIYSPAISSGVSIEVPHFTRHYGVFYGQVVPSDAIQMLRRDRTANEFVIGLGTLNSRREESAAKLESGFIQALLDTGSLNAEYSDANIDGDRISFGLADSTYTRMKLQMAAAEAVARNDFANNLICLLFSDGYDVAHLADSEQASGEGKAARKYAKGRVWDRFVHIHEEVETPSETDREMLLAQRSLTEEEKAKLDRWDIEKILCLAVDEPALKFFADGGKKKIALAELLHMDEMTARIIDRNEASHQFTYSFRRGRGTDVVFITAMTREEADQKFQQLQPNITPLAVTSTPLVEIPNRTFAALHRKRARDYFQDCGIDLDTGRGDVTQERLTLARDNLMNEASADEFNAVIRFGGVFNAKGKSKRPDAVFKQICQSFGYKPAKRRQTRSEGLQTLWSIDDKSWAFVAGILERRASAGVSAYEQKLEAGTGQTSDHDLHTTIDLHERSRSLEPDPLAAIDEAVKDTPVPLAWARTALTKDDLQTLLAMPLHLIRRVLGSLYFTEYLHTMSAGELSDFKNWQGGLNALSI